MRVSTAAPPRSGPSPPGTHAGSARSCSPARKPVQRRVRGDQATGPRRAAARQQGTFRALSDGNRKRKQEGSGARLSRGWRKEGTCGRPECLREGRAPDASLRAEGIDDLADGAVGVAVRPRLVGVASRDRRQLGVRVGQPAPQHQCCSDLRHQSDAHASLPRKDACCCRWVWPRLTWRA